MARRLTTVLLLLIIANFSANPIPYLWGVRADSRVSDSWLMIGRDANHSGFADGSAPHAPKILWNFTTGGSISASPLVANGSVYLQSTDGYLYSVNQSTGAMIWRKGIGYASPSSPAVYGDSLYACGNGSLYRVKASTGQIIWNTHNCDGQSSVLVAEGRVLVVNESSLPYTGPVRLYSVDAATGQTDWNSSDGYGEAASAKGMVFTGNASAVDALNASTGGLMWSFPTASRSYAGFTVSQGILFGGGDHPYALNSTTGNMIWENSIEGPNAMAPSTAYDRIFWSNGGGISALNLTTGKTLWFFLFKGAGNSYSQPAVADGLVFVGGGADQIPDPTLYALNASTGTVVWSQPVLRGANSSPAISNGTIFVGDNAGLLHAIGTAAPIQPSNQFPLVLVPLLIIGATFGVVALVLSRRRNAKRTMQELSTLTGK